LHNIALYKFFLFYSILFYSILYYRQKSVAIPYVVRSTIGYHSNS